MKKFFLLIVLFSIAGFAQPLAGNYTIGASQAAPFNTLTNAVNKLNAVGVSAPVTFLLNDASYTVATGETFPIVINQFAGTSATNTFTIRPNTGKTVRIQADNVNAWTSTQSVIKLNGADNVFINGSNNGSNSKNLTIINTNPLEYSKKAVIWFANENATNGASNNTISNLNIRQQIIRGDLSVGIYAGGTAVDASAAAAANSNNIIDNVSFTKLGQAVYVIGNSVTASQSQNWKITNATIGATTDADKPFLGIYLSNVKNYTISSNTIDGVLKFTTDYNPLHAGIYTDGNASEGTISNNKISNIKETTGSAGSSGIFVTGNNTAVYNNFINNVAAKGNGGINNNGYGIFINSGQNVSIYHNSVRLAENQSGGFSAPLFVNAGSNLNVVNNIFINSQTSGATRYAVYAAVSASAFTKIDYNDYVSAQHTGFIGSNRTDLASWKTATSQDSHSVSITPAFASTTDLHLAVSGNTTLDNLGTPIATVLTDIDAETRSTTYPDLGADEFEAAKCGSVTTWNGTAWNNGTPNGAVKAVLNGNYSTASGNIAACELVVNAGFMLTINTGEYVEVQNDASISGNIVVENGGSFIQVKEDSKDVLVGNGKFTMKRTTSPIRKFDFVYWSSPVENQSLYDLSPATRADKYYKYDPTIGNWVTIINGNESMANGRGYIARAPNEYSETLATPFSTAFVGKPHNGPISVSMVKSVDNMNLIGNPYPSAIDAKLFLSDASNSAVVGGTIYLWTHATAIAQNTGSNTYSYASDDYAAYNKVGGIKTNAAGTLFEGKVAAGQSFFAEALTTGTVVFKNSMRVKGNNLQFFKQSTDPVAASANDNRIWLNLTNEQGAFKQTLIGYTNGASDGYDQRFDGVMMNANSYVNFYSIVEDKNLVIQGRSLPFNNNQVIALGFSTTVAGSFSVSLDSFDGLFAEKDVYLVDKLQNTVQNLKSAAYTFTTTTGTFDNRFEIKFTNGTLATEQAVANANETIVLSENHQIQIQSKGILETVSIFDLNEKALFSKQHIDAKNFNSGNLNVAPQVLLVLIKTDSGNTTKKILFK